MADWSGVLKNVLEGVRDHVEAWQEIDNGLSQLGLGDPNPSREQRLRTRHNGGLGDDSDDPITHQRQRRDLELESCVEPLARFLGGDQNAQQLASGGIQLVKAFGLMCDGNERFREARFGTTDNRNRQLESALEIHELTDSDDEEVPAPSKITLTEKEGDQRLTTALGEFERDYVNPHYLDDHQNMKRELVQFIVEKFIHPVLREYGSQMFYTGSNYEHTGLQKSSDYDIQFCVKMPTKRYNNLHLVSDKPQTRCLNDYPGWVRIEGGPPELVDEYGFLSTYKVRRALQRRLDSCGSKSKESFIFHRERVTMTRSCHGPAITLHVEWHEDIIDIDIVPCVSADHVYGSDGWDMIAKPFDKCDQTRYPDRWRLSYSREEKKLFDVFNRNAPRKVTLMKIFKVIRSNQPQLRKLPSYFYKNILFKLSEMTEDSEWRTSTHLRDRFKDMVRIIRDALRHGALPVHFNHRVNLLVDLQQGKINQIAKYLERLIDKNSYYTIL